MLRKVLNREIISYLIVGVLTTIVSLATYFALVVTLLNPQDPWQLQIANALSWIAAVTFAYLTNRKYVFQSNSKRILREGAFFFLSRAGTLAMDMTIMFLMVTVCGVNDKIAKLLAQVVVIIANYMFSKFLVFKKE